MITRADMRRIELEQCFRSERVSKESIYRGTRTVGKTPSRELLLPERPKVNPTPRKSIDRSKAAAFMARDGRRRPEVATIDSGPVVPVERSTVAQWRVEPRVTQRSTAPTMPPCVGRWPNGQPRFA